MERVLGTTAVPLGLRFYPTDEELFMYYLKRKVMGKSLKPEMISEVDVYRFAPWDLPAMACLKTRDLNWFFFCPRSKKYPNGGRVNRATEFGYWKSTGNDRTVTYRSRPVGKIKTLVFHRGKAPAGERTDWVMHEYRLEDTQLMEKGVPQDSYVICKLYEKSGLGPRNGETYGAHFIEEEWESDDDDNVGGEGSEVVAESCDVSPFAFTSAMDSSISNAAPTTPAAPATPAATSALTTSAAAPASTTTSAAAPASTTTSAAAPAATTSAAATSAATPGATTPAATTCAPALAATNSAPSTVRLSAEEEEELYRLLEHFIPNAMDISHLLDDPPQMDSNCSYLEMDDLE